MCVKMLTMLKSHGATMHWDIEMGLDPFPIITFSPIHNLWHHQDGEHHAHVMDEETRPRNSQETSDWDSNEVDSSGPYLW